MTVNPKEFELRNLLGHRPPDVKQSCGVCGKPHATLTKEAKELPLHKRAIAEDWAGRFRGLTKALGQDVILDFANRQKFNAQLEQYRKQLTAAREEHDAMPQPVKVEKGSAKTRRLLTESLKMLGVTLSEGDHGIDTLATTLHEQVAKLTGMAQAVIAAEQATTPSAPAEVQPEINCIEQ